MSLEAHVSDPMVVGGKSVMVREGGPETLPCENCDTLVHFTQNEVTPVESIACSPECASVAFPAIGGSVSARAPVSAKSSKVCSVCGGPQRGRGFTHTETCTAGVKIKLVAICPDCGGPRRGRGFAHTDNCPALAKMKAGRVVKARSTNTCPQCGGAARGRGFAHTDTCPSRNVKKTTAKSFCPECNGPARGRGFAHNPGCSMLNKQVVKSTGPKEVCPICGGQKRGRGFSHTPDCASKAKIAPPVMETVPISAPVPVA